MSTTLSVDMLSEARNAQWDPETFFGAGTLKVIAPAKVNLFLGVYPKETASDAKHNVDTVMHALALHDVLYVHVAEISEDELAREAEAIATSDAIAACTQLVGPTDNIVISIDVADKTMGILPNDNPMTINAAENLVTRAADLLTRSAEKNGPLRIRVRIEKTIPAQAGLGGGSSDAAAMLIALANAFSLNTDDERVRFCAQELGADVVFFLQGGCARFKGVGDIPCGSLALMQGQVVLVKPAEGVSTAAAYAAFDETPQPVPDELAQQAQAAAEATDVPLFNNLNQAAQSVCPPVASVQQWLSEQPGVVNTLLCGSGATTFAIMDTVESAMALSAHAMKQGWWARATSFAGLRAAIVPTR